MTRSDTHRPARRASTWLAVAALAPALASATEGEQVVSGEATFKRDGSVLQIDTATPQTVIHWMGGFDIAPGATVVINQPSALANTLNYDLSSDVTRIEGSLLSNGGVWIINPVGVFFGDQAIVDVGRLVAGAGVVDPGDFAAGVERVHDLTGQVEVAAGAQIHAAESVLLVGAAVANYGHISAADGMIALVAGGEVRLARPDGRVIVTADPAIAPDPNRWGVVQAGTLDAGKGRVSLTAGDAYSLAINHTGITRGSDIEIAGGADGGVAVAGALDASDRSAGGTGGRIAVTGDRIALLGAQLDASGDAGGGEIRVGGDLRGEGELPTAKRTYVDDKSSLRADAIQTGDGGTIIVWSDEATRFYGALSARGGASGGDGGFAEISGANLEARGRVDLGASAGRTGTLLYDPKDIVLHAGTLDGTDAPDTSDAVLSAAAVGQVGFGSPDETLTPFDVYESELEDTNANILLQATNSISSPDSIDVDLDNRSLSMVTRNNAGDELNTTLAPGIHLGNVAFTTQGGTISLATGNAGIEIGDLTTSAAGNTGGAGGSVTISAGGDASAVSVASIQATGADNTNGRGGTGGAISLTGNTIAIGAPGQAATLDTSGGGGTSGGGNAGAITISAKSDVVSDAEFVANGGNATTGSPGGLGGLGGAVSIESETGNVTMHDTPGPNPIVAVNGGSGQIDTVVIASGVPHFDGQGGSAGRLDVSVAGAGSAISVLGDVQGVGGSGTNGAGGAGGSVTLTAADGGVTLAAPDRVDLSGGTGTGHVSEADGANADQGVHGGNGGNAVITASAGTEAGAAGGGDVHWSGSFVSKGGGGVGDDGTTTHPNPNDGTEGTLRLSSAKGLDAQIGGASDFANLEVIATKVAATVAVTGAGVTAQGAGSGPNAHTITNIQTDSNAPRFTYRLADGGGEVDQVDLNTLFVQNAEFGPQGGEIANARADATIGGEKLLGPVQGAGAGTVDTAGPLAIAGTNVANLAVDGAGSGNPSLALTVAGDVSDLQVVSTSLGKVDLTQGDAGGNVGIAMPGGGDVSIEGREEDNGAGRDETSVVTNVTTTGGVEFFYHLADAGAAGGREPVLRIARGAVDLGAAAGFSTTGDLVLQRADAEETVDAEPAITANGNAVTLLADANGSGTGAIVASTRGTTDIDVGSGSRPTIVLGAGSGVGSASPVRTTGGAGFDLVGRSTTGDFKVVHSGAGAIEVTPFAVGDTGSPTGGIKVGGVVELTDAAGGITLGGAQEDPENPTRHVESGGDQHYVGPVTVASDDARLRADGAVRFDGPIDADAAGRALDVSAGGTTAFAGDVGAGTPLDALKVTDASFEGDRTVHVVSSGDFRAIDGPGSLELRGEAAGSELVIRDNVGARSPLTRFDADAGRLVFDARTENGLVQTSADRIVAGEVRLNSEQVAPTVAPDATIADTNGGLSIESTGPVTMGAGEKLSTTAVLAISAGGKATLGDLSATRISVNAPEIEILGRQPGPVTLPSGGEVTQDHGVDWVANDITTNVVPSWNGAGTRPTFVLGSGGVETGGVVPFDVVRFTPDGDAVRAGSFAGPDGRTLDLTGIGPRAVSDASGDVPRAAPPVLPGLAARAGDEPPSPPREVSSEELIGALHCRTQVGDACVPPAAGDDPLASERALEIRQRYGALFAGDAAQQGLRAAFAPIGSVTPGDTAALSRSLAHDPALGDARARIGDLAVALAQVELLGLSQPESERARRAIAGDFAAATGVAGLDADAVLDAVAASGVAVLP